MSTLTVDSFFIDRDLKMSCGTRHLGEPQSDEALIRVEAAGLCGSDLHVIRSGDWVEDDQWPATLGHEIYGVVEQAPADGSLRVGDHVVSDSKVPCGRCARCLEGRPNHCIDVRFVGECRPGGFATHCVLPSSLLHQVPETLQTSTAALTEPLAVALHGLSHLRAEPRDVAILGHGPIGALIHIQLHRTFPAARVTVAEPVAMRSQLARACGADTVDRSAELSAAGFDTVIDAAGYGSSLTDALGLVAPRGQVLVLAIARTPVQIVPATLVESGISLYGSNAFIDEFPDALRELAADPGAYEPVITRAVSLAELPEVAAEQVRAPEGIKVLVCP